jgi:hypothetical protein
VSAGISWRQQLLRRPLTPVAGITLLRGCCRDGTSQDGHKQQTCRRTPKKSIRGVPIYLIPGEIDETDRGFAVSPVFFVTFGLRLDRPRFANRERRKCARRGARLLSSGKLLNEI